MCVCVFIKINVTIKKKYAENPRILRTCCLLSTLKSNPDLQRRLKVYLEILDFSILYPCTLGPILVHSPPVLTDKPDLIEN